MSLTPEDKSRINQLVESSKFENTIIVGSDIREMAMFIQKLELENSKLMDSSATLRRCLDTQEAFNSAQRHHAELCNKVWQAGVKARVAWGVGACGNGGIPTFGAVVEKLEECVDRMGKYKVATEQFKEAIGILLEELAVIHKGSPIGEAILAIRTQLGGQVPSHKKSG